MEPPINPSTIADAIHIDVDTLLLRVPALNEVEQHHDNWNKNEWDQRTWNEIGEKVARDSRTYRPRLAVSGRASENTTAKSDWARGKELVHHLFASKGPDSDALRCRMRVQNASTPILLHTLSLWLAGSLGISVSFTLPMVAIMLYAVAKSPVDWEILKSR